MDGRLLGGRYRLLESHAMGGMASVWRATDEESGEVVAVKRLHPHLVADAGARERLFREASALASIRHPNVVGMRGALDGDEPALVMDFVEGRSLAELIAEGHRFTRPETLDIAAAVADGLAAVHARGIVHRDVKPANVLIGQDGVARLSDFGIAVGADDWTALTAEDGVIGTLRYLAPERMAGEPASPATDVWGVGATLYELLTGTAAFPASTPTERVDASTRPVDRPKGLAEGTWMVLSKCLASDPEDRYEDGAALAAALHALPGVSAAAATDDDPSAATEVIAVPASVAASARLEPADDLPAAEPLPVAGAEWLRTHVGTGWLRSRAGWLAGAMAALVLAAMVGMSLPDRTPGDGLTVGAPSPHATADPPTPAPTVAEPTPAENADVPKPGKGKGDGKGKDKGRGN
jgi:serine/threonine protein kinase